MALSRWASAAGRAALPAMRSAGRAEIVYEVQRNGSATAEINRLLEHANGRYKLTEKWQGHVRASARRRASASAAGRERRAPGGIHRRAQRPRYRARLARLEDRHHDHALQGPQPSEPIPPNAQDRISFMLALAVAPAGAKTGDYHLVDGRGVSHHVYQLPAASACRPRGGVRRVKVVRSKDDDHAEFLARQRARRPAGAHAGGREGYPLGSGRDAHRALAGEFRRRCALLRARAARRPVADPRRAPHAVGHPARQPALACGCASTRCRRSRRRR